MQVAVVAAAGAAYRVEERDTPEPSSGTVRIRVHACGYCRSDENIRNGQAGATFPRVPGHEIAGTIEAIGADVPTVWQTGARVGVGWHGGHCLACDACRAGDFLQCPHRLGCGSSYDGGFATHTIVPHTALVRLPEGMSFADAAPLQCGGITVYNALRHSGATWGDRVAVQGLGGLGHLAVQFADKMGFEVVAVSRGQDKAALAAKLGAAHYVDAAGDVRQELRELGGVQAAIATAPDGASMRPLFGGLAARGRVVIVGVSSDDVGASASAFIHKQRGIQGSIIGTPAEAEAMLRFAQAKGVRPMTETFRLDDIETARQRLLAGRLRFRAVLLPA